MARIPIAAEQGAEYRVGVRDAGPTGGDRFPRRPPLTRMPNAVERVFTGGGDQGAGCQNVKSPLFMYCSTKCA